MTFLKLYFFQVALLLLYSSLALMFTLSESLLILTFDIYKKKSKITKILNSEENLKRRVLN